MNIDSSIADLDNASYLSQYIDREISTSQYRVAKKHSFTVSISKEIHHNLEQMAKVLNISKSALASGILDNAIQDCSSYLNKSL
jgi:hypothetical protein